MLYKNVPTNSYTFTFAARYFFDFLAFMHLLLKGNVRSAMAVVKAYRDFLTSRKNYKRARAENLSKTTVQEIPTRHNRSILLQFYSGKKTYQSIFGEDQPEAGKR